MYDDDDALERIADPQSDPEADALNSDLGQQLAEALARVPFAFRA